MCQSARQIVNLSLNLADPGALYVDAVFVIGICRRCEPAGPVAHWQESRHPSAANIAGLFDAMGVARAGFDTNGLW
jgi:hypothetical protein